MALHSQSTIIFHVHFQKYTGLLNNTKKSRQKDTIWMYKKMKSISTNLSKRMHKLRTMQTTKIPMMISSTGMKKLETFDTLIVALWIWGT